VPQGPFYPSAVDGEVPLAAKELANSGLNSPDEVKYLIAYHCGAFPNGLPVCLLRSLQEIQRDIDEGPNKRLQQTGHATDGFSGFSAAFRVSRLLSLCVRLKECHDARISPHNLPEPDRGSWLL
jgi:hypothetical protein